MTDTQTAQPSIAARFNALMAELDEAVADAGGHSNLDPEWKAGWLQRKAQLIAEIEAAEVTR